MRTLQTTKLILTSLICGALLSACESGGTTNSVPSAAGQYSQAILAEVGQLGNLNAISFVTTRVNLSTSSAYLISNSTLYAYNNLGWESQTYPFTPSSMAAADQGIYLVQNTAESSGSAMVYFANSSNLAQLTPYNICNNNCQITAITANQSGSGVYLAVFNSILGTQVYSLVNGISTLLPAAPQSTDTVNPTPSPSPGVFGLHVFSIASDTQNNLYLGGVFGSQFTEGYLAKYNQAESWETISAPIEQDAVFGIGTQLGKLLIELNSYGPFAVNDSVDILQSSSLSNWSNLFTGSGPNNTPNSLAIDLYGNVYTNAIQGQGLVLAIPAQ